MYLLHQLRLRITVVKINYKHQNTSLFLSEISINLEFRKILCQILHVYKFGFTGAD